MASDRIQLVDKDLPIHHFPSKPTCLAYDNRAKKLAIGCDNGEIIILDGQQCHILQLNVVKAMDLLLSFGVGKDIVLVAHKKSNHLFLWSSPYRSNPTQLVLPVKETPTVLAWSSAYSAFFVGTIAGTVYQVFVSDNKMKKEDRTTSMLRNKCVSAGEVVAIVEEPQTGENKGTMHNVLVVFSSGLCVLWNQQQGCSLQEQINDAGTSVCVPLCAWWLSSAHVFVACADGSIRGYHMNKGWKHHQASRWVPEGLKGVKSITKLQSIPNSTSLFYAGGCSSLPTDSNDSNNMVSKFTIFANEYLQLVPFGDRIADILYLQPSAEQDPSVLAVLTESELVLLNMSTKPQEIKHSCGTIMLQYPRLFQFNGYPHFTPPVTCLQYCGVCSQELLMTSALQPQSRCVSDLIVTGHKYGSVRLWLMFYDASFELTLVVYTAEYYEIPQGQPINLAGLKELSLVKVTSNQQYLLVVNKSCHVLLFKLYPHTTTSAQTTAKTKPQTHEVILMEVQDAMPPNKAIPTPSPHLHSCQWQTHVQLLQHFICYYMYKSGRSKKLDPVPVNCVEYDKELVMLAVGTDKGLIILDPLTNMLIQVIGSEKKLLELSGFGGDSNVSVASRSECRVVKLCTATIYSTVSQQDAQLKCWVGTVGGSLGVFTVTRRNVWEPLQLEKTGEGQQKNSAITSIQLIMQSPSTHGADTSISDTLAFLDRENITPTAYVVVTTEKTVENCYIDCVKKPVIKDTSINTILISWIGIIMDQPYLICLLKYGKVDIYALPDVTKLDAKNTEFDTKSMLYSSTGDFAMLQLFQREKLKLTTFKRLVASEV